jgi:ornithine carbamoyltransferase
VLDRPETATAGRDEASAVNKNFQQHSVVPVPSQSSPAFDPMQSMAGANTMDPVWQRLWLRCQQHDWQSMAFIGSSKRDPDGVLEIAHGMARLASELGQELTVFDARNLGLKDMGRMLAQIQSITSRGKRCIVVLKLVTENATTVPMAQNVDAALLGVFIGETSVVASSRTVEEVGRAKFLGSVVLNASLAK